MRNFVLCVLLSLAAGAAVEGTYVAVAPEPNYGLEPITPEEKHELYGDGEEPSLKQSAPHLFEGTN